MKPQEKADIVSVRVDGERTCVRGYQNYDITHEIVSPISGGHAWANTRAKWDAVDKILTRLPAVSFLDIGSNLGMYVFTAEMKHGLVSCGVDYNQTYVDECNTIAGRYGLNSQFMKLSFSELMIDMYDVTLSLGLIHHLYHRTEEYGSLEAVVATFHDITARWLILEFPTENDSKAKKWTSMPGHTQQDAYTQANFERYAGGLFSQMEMVEGCTPHRPIYLLTK